MIANFFNKTNYLSLTVTFVVFVIYYTASVLLYEGGSFTLAFFLTKTGLFFALAFLIALIYFVEQKNSLSLNKGYVSILTVLFLSSFPNIFFNSKIILANTFVLLACRKIYSLRTEKQSKEKIFDAAFWLGIAFLFYNWSLLFVILLYSAIIVFKKASFKNFIIPFVGLASPLFLFYTYHLYYNSLTTFNAFFNFKFSVQYHSYHFLQLLIPATIILSLLVWVLLFKRMSTKSAKIEFKSLNNLVVIHLLIAILIALISIQKNGSEVLFLTMPFVVLLSNYLEKVQEKWFIELVIVLFFVLPITINLLEFLSVR